MADPLRISAPPSLPPLSDNARWEAVLARDARFDDRFYYSVRTTGIYCRTSCPARRPSRAHVLFHNTAAEAEAAGFRACKRCKPDQSSLSTQHAAKLAQACQMIEAAESPPTLAALANAVGLSPYHFHRLFKAALGVTPKAYAAASRNKRVRAGLRTKATVTEAIYDAGFNSNSRFYAGASEVLGMGIKSFRAGGTNEALRCAVAPCSLGQVLVAATDTGVCAILLGDASETLLAELRAQFSGARLIDGDSAFAQLTARVVALVDAPGTEADLPLDVRGTAFQHRVWEALRRIPAGATARYADIAAAIGAPKSARAVAGACAANRLAVAIPCHRVVRGDGSLSGYRWGVARKRALLAKEQSDR
ncbi:MAG TPA: bifunctional DNA-binding transcriptional regulator/O6-methylguanine-DNA methyltransferase Ada [Methyloceanibacter sp.]|nr:bifunctional DNA-binding transcriptional regulator/O6-methylguanine-DNA methyltransferase Ada [Methyloceanibacter sp.]